MNIKKEKYEEHAFFVEIYVIMRVLSKSSLWKRQTDNIKVKFHFR